MTISAWLAADQLGRWPYRVLLEAICDEGRMPDMGAMTLFRILLAYYLGAMRYGVFCATLRR